MGNRLGSNEPLYDLSRLMVFASGQVPQNILNAPIILANPSITSGVALFSHTAQPFSVAVPALSELRLIDLSFANTGLATSQFYGVKIQTDTDVVDTGAGVAIFDTGRSDAIYIDVAGKPLNAAGNSPTGIGIDVNKAPTSTAENSGANSSQQGIQIWDWSTTDQNVGGPRGLFLNKYSNLGTHHILATLRGNVNLMQFVVISGDGSFDATEPAIRFDDETSGITWWQILTSGEQVFNKDGIGIQWITPGAKTAYILSSTNDLKLKSGGTGIRFVNQADTQTIVMMQDDLSVDIINNETRFQAIKIVSDRIEQYSTNGLGAVSVNYNGYNGGTTQFRELKIFDGKQNVTAIFTGQYRNLLFNTATDKATGAPSFFMGAGCTITPQSSGTLYIAANMWYTGAGYKRLIADNGTVMIQMSYAVPDIRFYFPTDANNTVDSAITYTTKHEFNKTYYQCLADLIVNNGDLYFVTAGSGLPYGSCWGNEINWSQASAAQNTWYIISDTDMSDGQLNLVTHDGSGKLTVTKAGRYHITYTISQTNDGNNKHIQSGIAVNGTVQNDGLNHIDGLASNIDVVMAGNAILSLAAAQYIEIAIRTTDTGTPTITVDHLNITIVQVGG